MLIKNGTIIDGTGTKGFKGDIRIEKDKIKEVGKLTPKKREHVIKAANKFVVPGFVDIINRSDIHFSIFKDKGLRSFIKQGVTTILGGNCGTSLAPLVGKEAIRSIQKWQDISGANINWASTKEFLDEVERHNISLNFATLTGHSTLRRGLVGDHFEKLGENDMKKMEYLLSRSMEEGSFGLSSGLAYSHERIVPKEELERLLKVVKEHKGLYATHLRDESMGLASSIEEIVGLTRRSGVSAHIFHFKALGKGAWGEFERSLGIIESAASTGIDINFDVYPYTRTASVLYLLLPQWASDGGKKKVIERLRDRDTRLRIREELDSQTDELAETVIGMGNIENTFIGKTLGEIAENQNTQVADALVNLIIASEDRIIGFLPISKQNMEDAMRSKIGFIASDGTGYRTGDSKHENLVHPRSFGAFPRFLGTYVRDKNILRWEEAINKITAAPANKIGLQKRGKIEKGYFADIVVFDPKKISDIATFKDPFRYSTGISHVIVNGGLALSDGKFQKNQHGRVLRK